MVPRDLRDGAAWPQAAGLSWASGLSWDSGRKVGRVAATEAAPTLSTPCGRRSTE